MAAGNGLGSNVGGPGTPDGACVGELRLGGGQIFFKFAFPVIALRERDAIFSNGVAGL